MTFDQGGCLASRKRFRQIAACKRYSYKLFISEMLTLTLSPCHSRDAIMVACESQGKYQL